MQNGGTVGQLPMLLQKLDMKLHGVQQVAVWDLQVLGESGVPFLTLRADRSMCVKAME